jgi:hypothetical protein
MMFAMVLSVILTISQPAYPVACPSVAPQLMKNADGTYTLPNRSSMTLQSCWSDGSQWQEEWTDYPEQGGTFIRRMPEGK